MVVDSCIRFQPTRALHDEQPKLDAALQVIGALRGGDGQFHVKLIGRPGELRRTGELCDLDNRRSM